MPFHCLENGFSEVSRIGFLNDFLQGGAVSPVEVAELKKLRKDREAYHLAILELRFKQTQKGGHQRHEVSHFYEKLIAKSGISTLEDVDLLDHDAYCAHFVYRKGKTAEVAESSWHSDLENPDVYKETCGDETYIAVKMPKKVRMKRSLNQVRDISQPAKVLKTAEENTSANQRLHAGLAVSLHSNVFAKTDFVQALCSGQPTSQAHADAMSSATGLTAQLERMAELGNGEDPQVLQEPSPAAQLQERTERIHEKQRLVVEISRILKRVREVKKLVERRVTTKGWLTVSEQNRRDFHAEKFMQALDAEAGSAEATITTLQNSSIDSLTSFDAINADFQKLEQASKDFEETLDSMDRLVKQAKKDMDQNRKDAMKEKAKSAGEVRKSFEQGNGYVYPAIAQTVFAGVAAQAGTLTEATTNADTFQLLQPMILSAELFGASVDTMIKLWPELSLRKYKELVLASPEVCSAQRFASPKAGSATSSKLSACRWWEVAEASWLKFGEPFHAAQISIPWNLGVKAFSMVSSMSALPASGFGGFLTPTSSQPVFVVLVEAAQMGQVTAIDDYLSTATARHIAAQIFRTKSISTAWLPSGAFLWIPPGCFPVVINPSEDRACLLWIPFVSKAICDRANVENMTVVRAAWAAATPALSATVSYHDIVQNMELFLAEKSAAERSALASTA